MPDLETSSTEVIVCPVCKIEFIDYKSNKRKYCSQECRGKVVKNSFKGKRIEMICGNCGKSFTNWISNRRNEKRFCSTKCSGEFRKGKPSTRLNWSPSQEQRIKISKTLTGRKHTLEQRRINSEAHKGIIKTPEWRRKISEAHKGEKSYRWEGGKEKENKVIRKGVETKLWREAVFKRDDWTCQKCYDRGGVLQADHIKPFSIYPEIRFDINNGQTLCLKCHKEKTKLDIIEINKWKRRKQLKKERN